MNIAAYCRVSTDKADQLNSLEAQKEFFSEYTNRTGDNLVRLYADEGISGTKIKKPEVGFGVVGTKILNILPLILSSISPPVSSLLTKAIVHNPGRGYCTNTTSLNERDFCDKNVSKICFISE